MVRHNRRVTELIQDETESILRMITSKIYSMRMMEDTTDENYESCQLEINRAKLQISRTCPTFDIDLENADAVIILSVNKLVIAACSLELKVGDNMLEYYHVSSHCQMGSRNTVQKYLLEEAARYSMSEGVDYMTIRVPLKMMTKHISIGFEPHPVEDMPNISDDTRFEILEVIKQASDIYENRYRGHSMSSNPPIEYEQEQETVIDILTHTLGLTIMEKIWNNVPGQIRSWTQRINRVDGLSNIVWKGGIILAKKLVNRTIIDEYPIYFEDEGVVSTLGDQVNRFIDLVEIKTYDLEDRIPLFESGDSVDVVCQDTISVGYIKSLRNGFRNQNIVMSIEVSGVVLAFCIITFKGVVPESGVKRTRSQTVYEPYVHVHVICARRYSGIGKFLLKSAQKYAMANDINVMRLDALPTVINWYYTMGFELGYHIAGNNPDGLYDDTPNVEKVVHRIYSVMKDMKNGIFYDHGYSEYDIKALETHANLLTLDLLDDLVINNIFTIDPVNAKIFTSRFRGFLLIQAEYLRTSGAMVKDGEWDQVSNNGIKMVKRLKSERAQEVESGGKVMRIV